MNKVIIIFLFLFLTSFSYASKIAKQEFICPIDGHEYTDIIDMSGTRTGRRLDMKPLGAISAPWHLPTCPECGFPYFKHEFSKEDISKYRIFINSDSFKKYIPDSPSYFLLAKIKEFDNYPAEEIAFNYIQASWQVEKKNKVKYKTYLQLALEYYLESIKDSRKKDEDWLNHCIMVGEIERQLGRFDSALIRFKKLQRKKVDKEIFSKIINQEIELCHKQISLPQKIER